MQKLSELLPGIKFNLFFPLSQQINEMMQEKHVSYYTADHNRQRK